MADVKIVTVAKLKERLLVAWHGLVLGRTAKLIAPPLWAASSFNHGGTAAHLAYEISKVARQELPLGIAYEFATRHAADVAPGTVRIVLETR